MSPIKIGVLISGGGSNLQSIIDKINEGYINGEIKLIVSNKKDAYGLKRGKNNNIKSIFIDQASFKSEDEYNKYLVEKFEEAGIELVVLAGYLRVLSKDFVRAYRNRIINIHPSLIPSFCGRGYYGKRVHEAALEYGVKISGATVHFVDEGTDTGPIIMQGAVPVNSKDSVEDLQKRVLKKEHELLAEAVKLYCDGKIKVNGRIVTIE